jgi:hypothetical protein
VAQRNSQKREYWVEQFRVEQSDLDHLYSMLLDQESPLSVEEMALILVRHRVKQDDQSTQAPTTRISSENQYHPTQTYRVGDKAAFPSMDGAIGKVVSTRPGSNPEYASYTVLEVTFDDGRTAEFASELSPDQIESEETVEVDEPDTGEIKTPEEIFIDWGGAVIESLEERLAENSDLVRLAGRWFPKSLLANVNSGHLNLAEAVLDLNSGGPMTTPEIIEQAGMLQNVGDRLAEFSLNFGLQQDKRFDEVGPSGQVSWYLTRLEPEAVQTPPERLEYAPLSSDETLLTADMKDLERQIGDEHSTSAFHRSAQIPQSVTVTLIYPHRRAGTLPLSPNLRQMFPTALRSPRIRFTLIDADTNVEYPAWVVREGGYVYGLAEYFEQHEVLPGSILTIERTKDSSRVKISAGLHKPRKEWVRTASVQNNRLRFESTQRPVATSFDELMVVDVSAPDDIDELWRRIRDRKTPLEDLMGDVMRDLAALNPQGHVHAKTLYSAVNLILRTPPGPIFARLVDLPEFEQAGGPYWRLREGQQ